MQTLVLNCGSSSVKFAVIDPITGAAYLTGLAERLGTTEALVKFERNNEQQVHQLSGGRYVEAFDLLLQELKNLGLDRQVSAIGHRVVHGGEAFSAPALLTADVMKAIQDCVALAPLHNPANIAGIEAAQSAFPDLPHVGVFDTAFHQTMPEYAYRYAVPEGWYSHHGVRRYGFHGTSHAFVAAEAAKLLGKPLTEVNLVTAHLGNGCSVAAIRQGESQDSSMGLTPLEGLVMGTRSGNVDPGLHDFIARQAGLNLCQVTNALNKESGLLGLSGLSNDMRELEAAAEKGHAGASLAIQVFVYALAKQIAALTVPLGRLDALVFTGGIGENSASIRAKTLEQLQIFHFKLDKTANMAAVRGTSGKITLPDSLPALVVNTNEEWMIARETAQVIQEQK